MIMKMVRQTLIAAAICLPAAGAHATEDIPAITLNMRPPQDLQLRDGMVIGRGQVFFQEQHSGYQVWLDSRKRSTAPARYVLTGKRNPAHQMRVRLAGEGWSAENKNNGGIVSATADTRINFDIVVDGSQQAEADEYVIAASAAAIVP